MEAGKLFDFGLFHEVGIRCNGAISYEIKIPLNY